MYAIEIGRKFLQLYNERERKAKGLPGYTAREFFDEVYYPLFFDVEEDEKHLISITNSAFTNVGIKGKANRLNAFLNSLASQDKYPFSFTGSNFPGGKSKELEYATTAQVTNLKYFYSSSDMILAWIGTSFGFGLKGGLCILLDDEDILFKAFEGWKFYREFLNKNNLVVGRQIETWNSMWLQKSFTGQTDIEVILSSISNNIVTKTKENEKGGKKEYLSLSGKSKPGWWEFCTTSLANKLNGVWVYVYLLGTKYNQTCGFLYLDLEPVRRLRDVWKKIFGI
jgi:hypothetical protein